MSIVYNYSRNQNCSNSTILLRWTLTLVEFTIVFKKDYNSRMKCLRNSFKIHKENILNIFNKFLFSIFIIKEAAKYV